ncbi:MAG: glycosyltransferase family 4 protein [Gemmatimonadota bacterium]|nr:MAG: glycosyltransferase family 4 protein [Gemmatimonadota bacterium]
MLLDFANRAFEHDIALRVLTPLKGPLVRILKNIGVPTAVVDAPERMLKGLEQVTHRGSLVAALPGFWRWSRRLSRHEYMRDAEAVYSTGFKPHLALALTRRHPIAWHLHAFPPEETGRLWRWLARHVPEATIANSHAVGAAWSKGSGERGAGSGRLAVVVPNGINLDRFKPAERTYWIHDRLGIPRDHRLLGMPAVFHRWKGQVEVIRAFGQLADEFEDVHLVIVGGSIYDTLAEREFAKELSVEIDRSATGEWQVVTMGSGPGITGGEPGEAGASTAGPPTPSLPRVHLLPFQSKIENTYPEFDFAVHYSTRPEPFGRVIVEAMACAIPVIAADEGGPQEILGQGIGERREAGWLAEPRNPAALAHTLRCALRLPTNVARSIGEAGRRRAEDFYSWRRFAADVARVLREVAEQSQG